MLDGYRFFWTFLDCDEKSWNIWLNLIFFFFFFEEIKSYGLVGTCLRERFDRLREPDVRAAFSSRSMKRRLLAHALQFEFCFQIRSLRWYIWFYFRKMAVEFLLSDSRSEVSERDRGVFGWCFQITIFQFLNNILYTFTFFLLTHIFTNIFK